MADQTPRRRGGQGEHPGCPPGGLIPVGLEIAVPILLLVGLPRFLGFPLPKLLAQMPDVGTWLIVAAPVGLLVGVVKAWWAVAWLQRRGAVAGPTAGEPSRSGSR